MVRCPPGGPALLGAALRWRLLPLRSRTACSFLPPEGAAAPVALQRRFHGPCWNEDRALALKPNLFSHPFVLSFSKDLPLRRAAARPSRPFVFLFLFALFLIATCSRNAWAGGKNDAQNTAQALCKPVYLTIDTGHMDVAPLISDILHRHQVKVTFFAANERTKTGDGSLGAYWAPWWKARALEGHEFASHTFNHTYWRADVPGPLPGAAPQFRVRASAGASEGKDFTWSARQYCDDVGQSSARLQDITGKKPLPLFRAPGGKTSPALLAAARSCGYAHVGWSPAGFLGDELPSDKYPNSVLLGKALRDIRSGDVLLAHLGIWSRQDPWAPAAFEPLITGLQARGFCFKTLREHPQYAAWIAAGASSVPAATPK